METHRRFCCRKIGQKPRYKPHPKHPVKVHVWAGISWNGATRACIFDGIMDAKFYCQILDDYLVPFIRSVYPQSHRFMQDNDPKYTSGRAQAFFSGRGINWWRTPPEQRAVLHIILRSVLAIYFGVHHSRTRDVAVHSYCNYVRPLQVVNRFLVGGLSLVKMGGGVYSLCHYAT